MLSSVYNLLTIYILLVIYGQFARFVYAAIGHGMTANCSDLLITDDKTWTHTWECIKYTLRRYLFGRVKPRLRIVLFARLTLMAKIWLITTNRAKDENISFKSRLAKVRSEMVLDRGEKYSKGLCDRDSIGVCESHLRYRNKWLTDERCAASKIRKKWNYSNLWLGNVSLSKQASGRKDHYSHPTGYLGGRKRERQDGESVNFCPPNVSLKVTFCFDNLTLSHQKQKCGVNYICKGYTYNGDHM